MTLVHAEKALLPEGWATNVRVVIGADGRITDVQTRPGTEDPREDAHRVGLLLPAPANAHSHAFQRAMAGLTEQRGPDPRDTFWTWRQLMYRFLNHLTPDHVQAIAAFVQMEMLEAGYATNVEFHYLHHQPDGQAYDSLHEMSSRIAAAAADTGIGLTLLPVLYQFGGCDQRPLGPGQIRFGNDPDRFAKLTSGAREAIRHLPDDTGFGVAPHSLRAVGQESLRSMDTAYPAGPVHMHLAEQVAEVEEVRDAWGARPVTWALDNMQIDERWVMIHCTQMEPDETERLARSGAIAGLCPITESSLGDGIFDGVRWMDAGGAISVGSDSNIRIALTEELRTLDYSQRLRDRSRAALASPRASTGRRLFDAVTGGGARAAGRPSGSIAVGQWADLIALDQTHVDLAGREGDALLDCWIFAADDRVVRDVWAAGRHVVTDGRHRGRARIVDHYRRTLSDLRDAL